MKKYLFATLIFISSSVMLHAKQVKFAVDMSNKTVNVTGIHISGDFQVAAGYASDWCSDCTPLTKEGSTNIYSIVVNIPAFKKYEFKFLNGDQFYEAEFVPIPSRVGYDFNDNRWIYVDSLSSDITFAGAIFFEQNAPANLLMVRFLVDMQKEIVSAKDAHVAGNFQSWDTKKNRLYHFDLAPKNIYEIIAFVSPSTIQYKYYNGDAAANSEVVPLDCSLASNGNRSLTVTTDTVLTPVCFSSCTACGTSGIADYKNRYGLKLYPNPTGNECTLSIVNKQVIRSVVITDIQGKLIRNYTNIGTADFNIKKENLQAGIYFVNVLSANNSFYKEKLIIE